MLGVQFDPILSLALNRQRHADLIAEAQQQRRIQAALDAAAGRTRPRGSAARDGGARRPGRGLTSLWRALSFAAVRS
jgi:hypothetical protein